MQVDPTSLSRLSAMLQAPRVKPGAPLLFLCAVAAPVRAKPRSR